MAAALAGIGVATWQSARAVRGSSADIGADLLPDVGQRIRDFRRVKMKNGHAVWEIEADDAQYFNDESQVVVTKPKVTFYLEGGKRRAHLVGDEGKLTLDGKELSKVTLKGDVVLLLDDLEVRTGEANYDHANDKISAPGPVTIRGQTLDVTGLGMEVEVTPRRVHLLSDVHTVFRNKNAAAKS